MPTVASHEVLESGGRLGRGKGKWGAKSAEYVVAKDWKARRDFNQVLIRQLMHPSLNQSGFSTYPLIQKLTDRFYPKAKAGGVKNGDLMVLEGVSGSQ